MEKKYDCEKCGGEHHPWFPCRRTTSATEVVDFQRGDRVRTTNEVLVEHRGSRGVAVDVRWPEVLVAFDTPGPHAEAERYWYEPKFLVKEPVSALVTSEAPAKRFSMRREPTFEVEQLRARVAELEARTDYAPGLIGALRERADAADREVGYAMADRCSGSVIDERRFKADGFAEAVRVAEEYVTAQKRSDGT